jgi:hypothetical protein
MQEKISDLSLGLSPVSRRFLQDWLFRYAYVIKREKMEWKGNLLVKSIINGAFRNKAAMIIIVIMVLAMGILSYFKLPMEFLPEADNPQVTVSVIRPGYDASSMDRLFTGPLEKSLTAIKGKTNAFSSPAMVSLR